MEAPGQVPSLPPPLNPALFPRIIGTARIVYRAGFMKRHGVRPSVPAWAHSSKPAAEGLLLWTRRAGDIDRLLQQRRANAGSATLSVYVGS